MQKTPGIPQEGLFSTDGLPQPIEATDHAPGQPFTNQELAGLEAAGMSATEMKDVVAGQNTKDASVPHIEMTDPRDQPAMDEMQARYAREKAAGVVRPVGLDEQKEHFTRTSGQLIDPENR